MASQPGYSGVANATTTQRSRLRALIVVFSIMLALAILIFVAVFAVFGLQNNQGDGARIPVAVGVGTSLTVVITGILLCFLKWWSCARSRYPSMPGNRRHGYRMDVESIGGYGDFRALDTPTKIGVVMNAVGRWVDGLAMALFPCCGRDQPRSRREARDQEGGAYIGYEMSRGVQPPKVSTSSSKGSVADNQNRNSHGESRPKFSSFDSVVDRQGILKEGERQSHQTSASSQASGAAASSHRAAPAQEREDSSQMVDPVQERPRMPSIEVDPPVENSRTIQHPIPAQRQVIESNRESTRWESTSDELFLTGSRASFEPGSRRRRDRYGSMQSDASGQTSPRSAYRSHPARASTSLRSSVDSVRLDDGPGHRTHPRIIMHAPFAGPQPHDRLAVPDVPRRDLTPGRLSGIASLPSQGGHLHPCSTMAQASNRAGATRPLFAPDRRCSTEQMEQGLRDDEGVIPPTRPTRQIVAGILEYMEGEGRERRARSTQRRSRGTNRHGDF